VNGRLLALLALSLASINARATSWADLWSRPDVRAERLLDAGDAAAAVPLFTDPRRKAYAEIKARRFADAANLLQPLADPQSQYNRGNALARAGKLREALASYDRALARAPAKSSLHRDARHNRDLVARQLKAQQKRQSAGGKSGQNKGAQGKGAQGKGAQNKGAQRKSAQGQPQQGQRQQAQAQGQQQAPAQQAQQPVPQGPQQQAPASGQGAPNKANGDVDAARAKRDAAAALGRAPRSLVGGTRSPPPPESEQAMSLDQWLRWIPDDPAGLLRRKFMIEHMQQQRRSQP